MLMLLDYYHNIVCCFITNATEVMFTLCLYVNRTV